MTATSTRAAELERGTPVKVAGLRGTYVYVSTDTPARGPRYVTVYGGTGGAGGRQRFRCVDPERVREMPRKRTKRSNS